MEIINKRINRERVRDDAHGAARPVVDVNWVRGTDGNGEEQVFSRIDEKPKSSHGYYDCMGVAAVGTETKTGKKISFLSHQSTETVIEEEYARAFKTMLRRRLKQIQRRSDPDSVSVVHFGGRRGFTRPEMVNQVRQITKDAIGVTPKTALPDRSAGESPTHAVLDTKRARLHLLRGSRRA